MMQPESLVKLIGSGNTRTVEEEWMRVAESPDLPLSKLVEYQSVLVELGRVGNVPLAETLAWAAIEALSGRCSALETLVVARPFLLAVGDSQELRGQITELYRSAYGERDGLEALLSESGIEGGRPVRRALRALDACLALSEGDYLVARYEDGAARIDRIDPASWEFTILVGNKAETVGAVHLADRFEPASPTDFRVMRRFAPDELAKRLKVDPASVVVEVCRQNGDRIDSDRLEALLAPELTDATEWKKWWPRARTALKRCPNIRVEGRSPYTISYTQEAVAPEDSFLTKFEKLRNPLHQYGCVEGYLRECKQQGQPISTEALRHCYGTFRRRAVHDSEAGAVSAGLVWITACQVGKAAGIENAAEGAIKLLKTASDLPDIFALIKPEPLVDLACTCLMEARPDDWQEQLFALLPTLPFGSCDRAACRLIEAGRTVVDFEPVIQRILASPIECFEAMLWLWDGPSKDRDVSTAAPIAVLTRVLRALQDARVSEKVTKERVKEMRARTRSALGLRKYERFDRCIEGLGRGMARALRRQLARADILGRVMRDDLLTKIDARFPPTESEIVVHPWDREDVLFVTRAGKDRKHRDIDELVNVKMKENARAIGQAAERGDLSENSEYKFALEERDLLRARLAQMNAEMALAEVISPEDVPTDHVGIGTRVVFRRVTDGEPYEITFLGPWDADPSKERYNYQAPLGEKVLGKRVGDTVDFDHSGTVGTYEIVSLHDALAE